MVAIATSAAVLGARSSKLDRHAALLAPPNLVLKNLNTPGAVLHKCEERCLVGPRGFEPLTSSTSRKRSSQLS